MASDSEGYSVAIVDLYIHLSSTIYHLTAHLDCVRVFFFVASHFALGAIINYYHRAQNSSK